MIKFDPPQMMGFFVYIVEKIVGKQLENAGYQNFLLFPQYFRGFLWENSNNTYILIILHNVNNVTTGGQ